MTAGKRAPRQSVSQRDTGVRPEPQKRPDFAAERDAAALRRGGPAWSTGLSSELREQPGVPGVGSPLPARLRHRMERRFDWDFGEVRVHDDAAAGALLRDRDAHALASGSDLLAEPGALDAETAEGRDRLEHELAHVVQQQRSGGSPALLADRRSKLGGYGREAPTVPFEVAEGRAPEDAHLLFDRDNIAFTDDALAALVAAVGAHEAAVRVELHGYASEDGGETYNLNLSAQRAAAVKAELEPYLPPNSEILLYAHGETRAFGGAYERNRRVGLRVMPRPTTGPELPPTGLSLAPRLQLQIDLPPPPGGVPSPEVEAPDLEDEEDMPHIDVSPDAQDSVIAPEPDSGDIDPFRYTVPPLNPRCPHAPGVDQMDWYKIVAPLSSRGGRLTSAQTFGLSETWATSACTYSFILAPIVGPERAGSLGAKAANMGLSSAMDSNAYWEHPSEADRFDQQLRREGINTTIIPVSDILIGLYELAVD